ncbi:fatty acid desaturase 6-like [Callospermophilus lateralis]|uniref:fatty acid desaturase 6-like n=1 Tax=Callospermophilus lateralis TaxID=76772 RepID=UPI004053DECE
MELARGASNGDGGAEALLGELEGLVQDVVRTSSWWERHGVDCAILALSLLALPAGFLCLSSENVLVFAIGIIILGVCHSTLTVKGSHLATHGALTKSKRWSKIWLLFFVEPPQLLVLQACDTAPGPTHTLRAALYITGGGAALMQVKGPGKPHRGDLHCRQPQL